MDDNSIKGTKKKPAIDVAADYLSHRMRTTHEVIKRLREKEYREEEIQEAIASLTSFKYLDDYEYARRFFEYNGSKHRGAKRAVRELAEKGVSSETIQLALEDYEYESDVDELAEARLIAEAEASKGQEIDERMIARVARRLESRGFKHDDIYKIMAEMRRWKDTQGQ